MPRPLLFDTTALVATVREPAREPAFRRTAEQGGYLTSVTVAELLAGSRTPRQSLLIDQLAAVFERNGRLLAPTAVEWAATGKLIARAIARRGAMEPRDHYPDVLIAQIAGRIGAAIITDNVVDFRRWISVGSLDATVRTS